MVLSSPGAIEQLPGLADPDPRCRGVAQVLVGAWCSALAPPAHSLSLPPFSLIPFMFPFLFQIFLLPSVSFAFPTKRLPAPTSLLWACPQQSWAWLGQKQSQLGGM